MEPLLVLDIMLSAEFCHDDKSAVEDDTQSLNLKGRNDFNFL